MFRHRRVSLYVMRELAGPTLLGLFLYTFVLMMNHFFLVAEKALQKNLGAELTAQLFLVGIPKLLVMSIPMAVLLGTLIALGRLSSDHEWVALQSAGQGTAVILRPVIFHGLLGALASFVIYAVVVPQTNYAFRNLRGQVIFSSNLASDLKPRVFEELSDNAVLFVDEIRPGGHRRLEGVLLIQPDPERKGLTQMIVARYGDLYPAPDGSGALIVDFYDGEVRSFQKDPNEEYHLMRFEYFEGKRLEPPSFIQSLLTPPDKVVQDLSLAELWGEVKSARDEQRKVAERQTDRPSAGLTLVTDRRLALATVELHQRLALPVAAFVFALLALPLGITGVRSGKGAGFAMSLVVILVYRIVFVLSRNQAIAGKIPAALGPWIADIVILVWAVIALSRLRHRTTRGPGLASRLLSPLVSIGQRLRRIFRRGNGRQLAGQGPDVELAPLGGTSRRFVGRLDRYVGLAYLRVLGLALASCCLVYALVELQGLMDDILRTQQPLSLILGYFQYFVPTVLRVVLPISCLVGAIVAITLLSRSGELVAVTASGVGLRRATLPVLILTFLFSGLLFLVEDRISPAANRKAQAIKDQITGRAPRTHGRPQGGRWSFGPDGKKLYHYRLYDPGSREFQRFSVFSLDRKTPSVLDHRYAERARWNGDAWELENGWYRSFLSATGSDEAFEEHPGKHEAALDTPTDLVSQQRRLTGSVSNLPQQMSSSELRQEIRTMKDSGYDITHLQVAYYGKFAHASTPLVMVLLGLPFAFKVGRRGSLYGIGVALLLVLVYWATFAIFNALGLETLLRPSVATWAPNVLFGLLGTYLMLYIRT